MEGLKGAAADARGEVTMNELGDYVQTQVANWSLRNFKKQTPDLQQFGAAKIVMAQKSKTPILDSLRLPDFPPKPQPNPQPNIAPPAEVWPPNEDAARKLKRLINFINIQEDVQWTTPAIEANAQAEPYNSESWRARMQWPNVVLTQRYRRGRNATQFAETVREYTIPLLQMMASSTKRLAPNGLYYPIVIETKGQAPLITQRTAVASGQWTPGAATSSLTIKVQDPNMADGIALEWKEGIRIAIGSTLPDEPETSVPATANESMLTAGIRRLVEFINEQEEVVERSDNIVYMSKLIRAQANGTKLILTTRERGGRSATNFADFSNERIIPLTEIDAATIKVTDGIWNRKNRNIELGLRERREAIIKKSLSDNSQRRFSYTSILVKDSKVAETLAQHLREVVALAR